MFLGVAEFEEKNKEAVREGCIYKFAPDHVPKGSLLLLRSSREIRSGSRMVLRGRGGLNMRMKLRRII